MILVIDNFDSFTFNIVEHYRRSGYVVQVFRNTELDVDKIESMQPSLIVLSPGPKDPSQARNLKDIILHFASKIPLFGVCLGCQAIAHAYGAKIIRAEKMYHGKTSVITHNQHGVLEGLHSPMKQMRYHSLIIDETTLPKELEVTARSENGEIMAIRHRYLAMEGVQFHPESIASEQGEEILDNATKLKIKVAEQEGSNSNVSSQSSNAMLDPDLEQAQLAIANKLLEKKSLNKAEATELMAWLSDGLVHEQRIAMYLTAFRMKGETADELAGIAQIFRSRVVPLPIARNTPYLVDIVGTGGDKANTFNISTASAIVAAGAGAKVAKHGNRAVTSKSGSADVLEALGITIEQSPKAMAEMLERAGMCFMFAPLYHPSMKHVAPVRKQLKIRTLFNILGPLVNPALVPNILLGVYSKELMVLMADTLVSLGILRALVVYAEIGSDEIALDGITHAIEIRNGSIHKITINPHDYFSSDTGSVMKLLEGGDADYNASLIERCLKNEIEEAEFKSAVENILALNAGAALYVADKVRSIGAGITQAKKAIHSGAAFAVLQNMRR